MCARIFFRQITPPQGGSISFQPCSSSATDFDDGSNDFLEVEHLRRRMTPFSVLIRLGTFASALAVVVVLLSLALPQFRSAIEGPFEALLPGIVDFGRESGCPPHALALTLT